METTTQSYFWPIFSALIFGILLLFGLLLEMLADRKKFKDTESERWWKNAKKAGEWFVIIGVFGETVIAGLAAKHERQMDQAIIRNQPLNQRVSEISAQGFLRLGATNVLKTFDPFEWRIENLLTLMEGHADVATFELGRFRTLMAQNVMPYIQERRGGGGLVSYGFSINYGEDPMPSWLEMNAKLDGPEPPEIRPLATNVMERITMLRGSVAYLPTNAIVIGGTITITVNGGLRKRYGIVPQQMNTGDLSQIFPRPTGLVFYATNSIP